MNRRARHQTTISGVEGCPLVSPASEAGLRVAALLEWVFKGLHHVARDVERTDFTGPHNVWFTLTCPSLDTWDSNLLTRLVVGAHEHAVRVEISAVAPRCLRLLLSPRPREGSTCQRHPTLAQHLELLRRTGTEDRLEEKDAASSD